VPKRKAGLPVLPELIDRHVEHLRNAHGFDYVVADSSLYSANHVEELTESGVKFVARVPSGVLGGENADSGGRDRVHGAA